MQPSLGDTEILWTSIESQIAEDEDPSSGCELCGAYVDPGAACENCWGVDDG